MRAFRTSVSLTPDVWQTNVSVKMATSLKMVCVVGSSMPPSLARKTSEAVWPMLPAPRPLVPVLMAFMPGWDSVVLLFLLR